MGDTCKDCQEYDLKEKWGVKYYCDWYKTYYHESDAACSHFSKREDSSGTGGCYITTIIHDVLGEPDNCEVLETFRTFRNNVLQKNENYKNILLEYDTVGPVLAYNIALDNDKNLCSILYEKSLKKIANLIKENKYDDAVNNYKNLVINLEDCYGIENKTPNIKNYNQEKGGHGKVYVK